MPDTENMCPVRVPLEGGFSAYPPDVSPNLIVGQLADICNRLNALVAALTNNEDSLECHIEGVAASVAEIRGDFLTELTCEQVAGARVNDYGYVRVPTYR